MTLHNVQRSAKRSRSRKSENFSKSGQIYYQNVPCDLTKKMNTHTLCFCPLIRKLQAFEILKWAKWSQGRKQRTSYFTREIQLIFSRLWKYSFLYFHSCEIQLFSSPEPKAPRWAISIPVTLASVVRPSSVRPSVRRPSVNIFKHLLLWNHWANWTQISYGDSLGWGNEKLFKCSWSHDQDGRHAHIW